MGKPDALSRRSDHGSGAAGNENLVLLKPEFFTVRAMEGVDIEGEEKEILSEIWQGVKKGNQHDPVVKATRELGQTPNQSVHSLEWAEREGLLFFRSKIYVPNLPNLRRRIVAACHDTTITGHPGRWKTLELVSWSYWWPQILWYIG